MPTYDYVCDACDHKFELYQGINDPVKRKCPECGKQKLRRLIGAGLAIMFKGSGFYQTDYRSEGYKKQAAADKSANSGETKSDSKPETKSESKSEGESESKSETKPVAKPSRDKGKSSKKD